MKKILLSCACCLLAVGLLAGCDEDVEEVNPEEPSTTVPSTGDDDGGSGTGDGSGAKEIVFGFEVDGVMNYIDGGTVSGYAYEGTLTTDVSEASKITLEESETVGAYYLSFDNEGTTNWVTIIENNGHTNLSYATEKALLYYNAEYECWGNADMDYFLCYNSTYKCLYATAIGDTRYGLETSTPSPIAALYYTDGSAVTGLVGYELVAPTTITVSGATEVYVGNSITLTVATEAGADKSVTWSWEASESSEGAVTVEGGVVTGVTAGEVVVTATSTVATDVSDSIAITVLDIPAELPFDVDEEYWLGYTRASTGVTYYFDGAIASDYYGDVKATSADATFVTVGEAEGGYTLSFTDEEGTTQYIYIYEADGGYDDFGITTEEFIWTYDFALGTFVVKVGSNDCYIGNYYNSSTTYNELRASKVSDYGSNSSNEYCIATLITPAEPTSITISGKSEVVVEESISLTATVPEGADYRVTWSISDGSDYASIDSATGVLTAGSTAEQTVKVIATSVKYASVFSEAYEISIVAESSDVLLCTYNFANAGVDSATSTSFSSSDAVIEYFAGTNIFEAGACASSPLTSASDISYAYHGAGGSGSNSGLQLSGNCLKLGKSSTAGTLTLTFSGVTITGVELVATSWSTTNQTLTINSVSQTFTQAGTLTSVDEVNSYTYELSDCSELAMSSTERVLIFSMALYGTVTA